METQPIRVQIHLTEDLRNNVIKAIYNNRPVVNIMANTINNINAEINAEIVSITGTFNNGRLDGSISVEPVEVALTCRDYCNQGRLMVKRNQEELGVATFAKENGQYSLAVVTGLVKVESLVDQSRKTATLDVNYNNEYIFSGKH